MELVEKANGYIEQVSALINVSLVDILSGAFMRAITFLVNLLLGL